MFHLHLLYSSTAFLARLVAVARQPQHAEPEHAAASVHIPLVEYCPAASAARRGQTCAEILPARGNKRDNFMMDIACNT